MQNNNNNIKKVIPEPLLFIHTVSTPIMSNGSQRYYDSRDPEKSKSKEKVELIIGKEENKKSEIRKAKKIELQKPSLPIKKCEIFEIENTTETDLNTAENKISGEYVYAYPPGSPIIAPGEVISKELITQIKELYKNGVNILSDSNLLPLKILTKTQY